MYRHVYPLNRIIPPGPADGSNTPAAVAHCDSGAPPPEALQTARGLLQYKSPLASRCEVRRRCLPDPEPPQMSR